MKRNSGIGFLMFSDQKIVKDYLYDHQFFFNMIREKLTASAIRRLNMNNWFFASAYSESDIIWEDVYKDSVASAIKTFMLWILLLTLSIIIVTPVVLASISTEIIANLNFKFPFIDNTNTSLYISSAMTVFCNVILIPFFIDIMVLLEDHPTKSRRQLAILNRNYFFMLLNSFLLPLTFTSSIKAFIKALNEKTPENWPAFLGGTLLTQYNYFVTYFI